MKHDWLLPYGFKKIGWGFFALALLLFTLLVTNAFYAFIPESLLQTPGQIHLTFCILFGVGIPLVALSRERTEDEMIAQLRIRTVTQTAYVFLIAFCAWSILSAGIVWLDPFGAACTNSSIHLLQGLQPALKIPMVFVCYIFIFQWRLWRLKRWAAHED